MTVDEVTTELKRLGDEKLRKINSRNGAPENQFGVKMGDIRAIANKIKSNPELAAELWETRNWEAMRLSTLLMKPKQLSLEELDRLVRTTPNTGQTFNQLGDWLMSYVVKQHPQKEELRQKWMQSDDMMAYRSGWSLTAERVAKNPDGLDIPSLLDQIEREMGSAPAPVQWTMNFALAEIGINFPELRIRAIGIGEKLGIYRDYPVSKGCTSPFAPIWINEMVRRQS